MFAVLKMVHEPYLPLFSQLVHLTVVWCKEQNHSCFLYLAAVLVEIYGGGHLDGYDGVIEGSWIPQLMSMLEDLLHEAFKLLREPPNLCQHPDTVDELLHLSCHALVFTVVLWSKTHAV